MRLQDLFRSARAGIADRALLRPALSLSVQRLTRARPALFSITRLTATAVLGYLIAHAVIGRGSVLAPLTAILVVQVTLYQTFRSALQRVASVIAGVLVALGLSTRVGFTWWSLAVAIAASLAVGYALRLGDSVLEVPITAMLILSLPSEAVVTERILATLIGAATGLISNVVVAPLRVQHAEHAVEGLGRRLADLLDQMATDLAAGSGAERSGDWLARARVLTAELERVRQALGQAEESVRLNPRSALVTDPRVYLRRRLDVLEHVTLTIRGIARSLRDSSGVRQEVNPVVDGFAANRVADVIAELSGALRAYARLAHSSADRASLKADVDRHLASAHELQRAATAALRTEPAAESASWPLRGELLTHLDRLRNELQPAPPRLDGRVGVAQDETWRHPLRAVGRTWRQRRSRQPR